MQGNSVPSHAMPVYHEREDGEQAVRGPELQGEMKADIAVVGGGLAGLSVALSLIERGHTPVVLEASEVASGASARSGGFVQTGWAKDDDELVGEVGERDAGVLFEQARKAVALVRRRVGRYGIRTAVGEGVLEAFFHRDETQLKQQAAIARVRHEVPFQVLSGSEIAQFFPGTPYRAGILDPVSIHLDPLALARGYGRAVLAGGGQLFEHSPARALVPEREGFRIEAGQGRVRARQVVLATSVYGHDPDGRARRALLPVMSYIVVTEPLGQRLNDVVRASWAVFDDRFATGYWRPLPDGRLLWGGKVGLSETPRGLEAKMRADLAFIFPALADVRFAHVWSGRMGFTRHRMPLAGAIGPGLWLSTGFCGHGLGTTAAVGEMLADAITSGDRKIELISRFGRPWMGGPLGPLAAQLFYGWLDWRDRLRLLKSSRNAPAT